MVKIRPFFLSHLLLTWWFKRTLSWVSGCLSSSTTQLSDRVRPFTLWALICLFGSCLPAFATVSWRSISIRKASHQGAWPWLGEIWAPIKRSRRGSQAWEIKQGPSYSESITGWGPATDLKVRLKLRVVRVPSLAPEFSQVSGLVKKPGRWSRYWEPWLIAQWPGALEEYGHSFSHSGRRAEDFLCTSGPHKAALFCTFIDGCPLLPPPLGRRDELLG